MPAARSLMTLEEFLALSEAQRGERSEFRNGVIVQKALPSGRHGKIAFSVGGELKSHFRRGSRLDGTGGWWLQAETSVLHRRAREMHTHDLVGWRRERVPHEPLDYPVTERPDWVCEVAVSSMRKDMVELKRILEIEEVPHYWVVDAANEQLIVLQRIEGHLVVTRTLFREDGRQRIPPFESVELSVGLLLGDDPD